MTLLIKKVNRTSAGDNIIYLISNLKDLNRSKFNEREQSYIRKQHKKNKKDLLSINRLDQWIFVHIVGKKRPQHKNYEELRKTGSKLCGWLNNHNIESATLIDFTGKRSQAIFKSWCAGRVSKELFIMHLTLINIGFSSGKIIGYIFLMYTKNIHGKMSTLFNKFRKSGFFGWADQ